MIIKTMSASSYSAYDFCQFKWFMRYELGFPDATFPSAIAGSIAHRVLEIMARAAKMGRPHNDKVFNFDYSWGICYNKYKKESPSTVLAIDPKKLASIKAATRSLIESEYSPIRDGIVGIEHPFTLKLEEKRFWLPDEWCSSNSRFLKTSGFIDRIDKINDNCIEVIDYKTGRRNDFGSSSNDKKIGADLLDTIQAKIYYAAARQEFPQYESVMVTFIYLTDGGPISAMFDDSYIGATKDDIFRRYSAVKANTNPSRAKGFKCRMCPYSKDGSCETVYSDLKEFGYDTTSVKWRVLNDKA